ncbi:Pro-rich N-terminal domain-containing protein, partial [Streptomyces sp. NPDC001215]
MQHAVGAPLPPPHQPGQEPVTAWSPAAHQPGQPGAHPGPAPHVPPAPGFAGPAVPPGPPHTRVPPHQAPVQPAPDTTAQVGRPPGAPDGMPGTPPAVPAPDPSCATLAVLLIGPAGARHSTGDLPGRAHAVEHRLRRLPATGAARRT